jgi:hypothetical protein
VTMKIPPPCNHLFFELRVQHHKASLLPLNVSLWDHRHDSVKLEGNTGASAGLEARVTCVHAVHLSVELE